MVANLSNMYDYFDRCNMAYFEGRLLFPQFKVLHTFRLCGYFPYRKGGWFDKKLYDPTISISDYYDFPESLFVDLMCHEMIHYYLAYYGLDRRLRHGKKFMAMAEHLNRTYNLNISKKVNITQCKRRKGTPLLSYWLLKMKLKIF